MVVCAAGARFSTSSALKLARLAARRIGHGDGDGSPDNRDSTMCRRAIIGLEPTPHAAGEARRFVTTTCNRWGISNVVEEMTLAVSELVTNAVLHARTHIDVELCVTNNTLVLCVSDRDVRPPVPRPVRLDLLADLDAVPSPGLRPDMDERHPAMHVGASGSIGAGRGLLIIDALADEWGVSDRADGKEVWLTIPVELPQTEPCVCEERPRSVRPDHGCRHIHGPWDDDAPLADTP
jgi:anti-sigma regulatory factor (Ser/Thr protein kinase)